MSGNNERAVVPKEKPAMPVCDRCGRKQWEKSIARWHPVLLEEEEGVYYKNIDSDGYEGDDEISWTCYCGNPPNRDIICILDDIFDNWSEWD